MWSDYQRRFGGAVEDSKYPPNDFIQQVLSRFTVRKFTNQPLAPGQLELLVAAAQSASSSGLLQTWSVIALTDKESKDRLVDTPRLAGIIGGVDSRNMISLNTSAVFLIWLADLHRADNILRAHSVERNISAGILLQTTKAEYQLKAIIDATIAAQTFALAAESQGLGIMYCGAVRQLPAEHFIKNFNLPPLTFPIFGMAVGHPAPAEEFGHISPRLPTDIVLHHGSYKTFDNMDDISAYNEIHKIFGQYKTSKDYVDRLTERMVVAHDKTQVAQSLKQMGFNFE